MSSDTYFAGGLTMLISGVAWMFLTQEYSEWKQGLQLLLIIAGIVWLNESRNKEH